jgi:hypothetical protein
MVTIKHKTSVLKKGGIELLKPSAGHIESMANCRAEIWIPQFGGAVLQVQ